MEIASGCLEAFPSALLGMVPYVTIRQSIVDKKLAAHLKAAGQQPKARRISNKKAGSQYNISTNGWANMSNMMQLELVRLDQKLENVVAMCAMANSLNANLNAKLEEDILQPEFLPSNEALNESEPPKLAPPRFDEAPDTSGDYGVYMHQGDVNRAYRNLKSCQTVLWLSGLYVIRVRENGSVYVQFLVDLALDFGATENPLQFAEPAAATTGPLRS
jgi:hypothetical protein